MTDAEKIRSALRLYGIKSPFDAIWIEEFSPGYGRMDLMTFCLRTWEIRGYEIKISRSDFMRDEKWHNYLTTVNLFFLVVLPGVLISTNEVPEEIGILEWDGEKFVQRRRAKRLQPVFVRRTYGEDLVTKMLVQFARAVNWCEGFPTVKCPKCNKHFSVRDGRQSGTGKVVDQ